MTSSAVARSRVEAESPQPSRIHALASAAAAVVLTGFSAYSILFLLGPRVDPVDFQMYRDAAVDITAGQSPYPTFAYPPLSALAAVPFTWVSAGVAELAIKALLILGVAAILAVLGVRDWRCYPLALLWAPVNAAVQTGNITIPLALGAALAWRFRERSPISGASLGLGVAAKLVLWPLLVWLAAVRRYAVLGWSLVVAVAVTLASWAIVDFSAMLDYPNRLRELNDEQEGRGYTIDALLVDLGSGETIAKGAMASVAIALLVSVLVSGRRGNERRSFVLAIAAALASSPIVWLHYFAFLLVPVAVVRPRLGAIWLVPLAMWGFGAGTGNGSTGAAAVVLLVAVTTIVLALREDSGRSPAAEVATSPVAARP